MKSCYLRRNKERLAFFEKQALLRGYASFRYTIVTSTHHIATNAFAITLQTPFKLPKMRHFAEKP